MKTIHVLVLVSEFFFGIIKNNIVRYNKVVFMAFSNRVTVEIYISWHPRE